MRTESCRVIVSCFIDGRSSRNNSPPDKYSCLSFLKKIIETEKNIKSNVKYDLIIINHDNGYDEGNKYIEDINNTAHNNGKIIAITIPNLGLSFDGYNFAYNKFRQDYKNWIFSEDDHIIFSDNYYDLFLEEYEKNIKENIGFLAFAPISSFHIVHSGGGFGLTKREILDQIINKFGSLACLSAGYDIRYSEIMFTNQIIQLGYNLIAQKTFSCYPINHDMCADHSIHRNHGLIRDNERYFFQVGKLKNEEW